MATRTLTTANQITILRLAFVPLFAILVVQRHYGAALGVLAAAALSDIMDGTVARVFHQESPLGMALDPIADKTLMTTAYILLASRGTLPWWLTILVLSRDAGILVTAAVISLVAGYRPFHPTLLGKASTFVQVATVFVAVAYRAGMPLATQRVLQVFVYLAATLTVASAVHYLIVARHRFAHPSGDETPPFGGPAQ
ncbi:MAG TPA: CDP-alcohol phosphatidyltransferase family protein [Terriglobia bacterium]|nr:CDP-alcohol phosphatidyltransferase family protein [Terriglobia bacterium]